LCTTEFLNFLPSICLFFCISRSAMESCMVCLMFLFQTICLSMRCSCWGGPMPRKPASRVLSRSS
jgi:hypothetical protein